MTATPDTYAAAREAATKKIVARLASKASCHAGCSACCSSMVVVPLADALLIAGALIAGCSPEELSAVARVLQAQANRQHGLGPVEWLERREPCVFLRPDGACGIYLLRPLSCRAYWVDSDPAECGPERMLVSIRTGSMRFNPLPVPELSDLYPLAQEATRELLHGLELPDLPPAPLAAAVLAALHWSVTGETTALATWASARYVTAQPTTPGSDCSDTSAEVSQPSGAGMSELRTTASAS